MNNDLDKDFEDHAWKKMRELLDQEQPTAGTFLPPTVPSGIADFDDKRQKRKDRGVLFFLLFWVLVGVGLMSKWAVQVGENNSPIVDVKLVESTEIKQSKAKPIEPFIAPNQENVAANIVQNKEGNKPEIETPIEPIYVPKNPIIQPKNRIEKRKELTVFKEKNWKESTNKAADYEGNLLTKKEVEVADNLIKNRTILIEKTNEINVKETSKIEPQAVQLPPQYFEQKEGFSKENDLKRTILEVKSEITILDSKPIDALKIEENRVELLLPQLETPPFVMPVIMAWRCPLYSRWGITLGANTEGVKQSNQGYQLGIVYQRELTPKFSLQTGLNFRRMNVENSNIPYTQLPDSVYQRLANAKSQTTPTGFVSYPTKNALLSAVNYLEMPVSVGYKFNENLSVFAGVKASFLLQASLINPNSISVASSAGSNFSVADRSVVSQSYSTENLSVNRWDLAVFGGVEYTFSQHFAANMKYDLGLKNVINANDTRQLYNRYLSLNLTYFITRTKAR